MCAWQPGCTQQWVWRTGKGIDLPAIHFYFQGWGALQVAQVNRPAVDLPLLGQVADDTNCSQWLWLPRQEFEHKGQFIGSGDLGQVRENHLSQGGRGFGVAACLPKRHAQCRVVGLLAPGFGKVPACQVGVPLGQQAAPNKCVNVGAVRQRLCGVAKK
ncbi:hypothetical protein [Pseudomonas putida]|uniref:hypothetical protein n=1 Tax=Pseudomonas putida TaxID=303 RepID=UPI00209C0C84|nr:hypothetical protein [Pseudomonas putida]